MFLWTCFLLLLHPQEVPRGSHYPSSGICACRGFPTRMMYLYYISCLRYTILVSIPWCVTCDSGSLKPARLLQPKAFVHSPFTVGSAYLYHRVNVDEVQTLDLMWLNAVGTLHLGQHCHDLLCQCSEGHTTDITLWWPLGHWTHS